MKLKTQLDKNVQMFDMKYISVQMQTALTESDPGLQLD